MMRAALLALMLAGCGPSPEQFVKPTTALIAITGDITCSGTMVGPRTLLTASHCFTGLAELLTINGEPAVAIKFTEDGEDHSWLLLAEGDRPYAQMGPAPKQGDRVFIHGNPGPLTDMLRHGVVAGYSDSLLLISLEVSGGDSGAGVFNRRGEVVGVITGYKLFSSGMRLAVVRPFVPVNAP